MTSNIIMIYVALKQKSMPQKTANIIKYRYYNPYILHHQIMLMMYTSQHIMAIPSTYRLQYLSWFNLIQQII